MPQCWRDESCGRPEGAAGSGCRQLSHHLERINIRDEKYKGKRLSLRGGDMVWSGGLLQLSKRDGWAHTLL